MPSRRNPVPIAAASTSKSSTTSTLMDLMVPGRGCQSSVGGWHRADTGRGVEPPCEPYLPAAKDDHMSEASIEVSGLRKQFGATLALDGMSFTVQPGQITGF